MPCGELRADLEPLRFWRHLPLVIEWPWMASSWAWNIESTMEMSMCWPRPVRSRW
ncbi:unannotated protein [freshwater metagenome]|uniref:Unannotated protein n=1 Tax=freshwater metagenome TaxID=449393 RepID=A0A6J6WZ96_9ZZZZ